MAMQSVRQTNIEKNEEYIEEMLLPVAELFCSKGVTISLQIPETIGQREPDGEFMKVRLPELAAWSAGTVFIS